MSHSNFQARFEPPPSSALVVLLRVACAVSAAGFLIAIAFSKDTGTRLLLFSAGSASALSTLSLASILDGILRTAYFAELTARNAEQSTNDIARIARHSQDTVDELSKMSKSRHSGSPAKAGTN